jgi:hypothetical protein
LTCFKVSVVVNLHPSLTILKPDIYGLLPHMLKDQSLIDNLGLPTLGHDS